MEKLTAANRRFAKVADLVLLRHILSNLALRTTIIVKTNIHSLSV